MYTILSRTGEQSWGSPTPALWKRLREVRRNSNKHEMLAIQMLTLNQCECRGPTGDITFQLSFHRAQSRHHQGLQPLSPVRASGTRQPFAHGPWPIANRAQDSKSPTSLRWVSAWTHIPLPVCMEPTMYVFLTRQLLARHLVRLQYSNAHHNRCLPKRAWAMTAPFRPDSTGDGAKRRLPNHRSKSHRLALVKTWRSSSTSTLVPTLAPR